jgi:hypothetical protein
MVDVGVVVDLQRGRRVAAGSVEDQLKPIPDSLAGAGPLHLRSIGGVDVSRGGGEGGVHVGAVGAQPQLPLQLGLDVAELVLVGAVAVEEGQVVLHRSDGDAHRPAPGQEDSEAGEDYEGSAHVGDFTLRLALAVELRHTRGLLTPMSSAICWSDHPDVACPGARHRLNWSPSPADRPCVEGTASLGSFLGPLRRG